MVTCFYYYTDVILISYECKVKATIRNNMNTYCEKEIHRVPTYTHTPVLVAS